MVTHIIIFCKNTVFNDNALCIYFQAKQYCEVPKDISLVVTAAVTMSEDTGQCSVPISLKLTRFMLATLTFQFYQVF